MNISRNQHVILLYKSDSSRNLTAAKCINQELKEGQLCIYASVNAYEPFHLTKISSLIEDYKDNLNKRNINKIDKRSVQCIALKISEYIYFFVINRSIDYSSMNVELAFVIDGYIQKGE